MSVLLRDEGAAAADPQPACPQPSDEALLRRSVADRSDPAFARLATHRRCEGIVPGRLTPRKHGSRPEMSRADRGRPRSRFFVLQEKVE